MIFGIKLVGTLMCEIGILPDFNIGFPFVTTGGVFIIYDLVLIGIILSIIRNESIAKDWVRLKKNGGLKMNRIFGYILNMFPYMLIAIPVVILIRVISSSFLKKKNIRQRFGTN